MQTQYYVYINGQQQGPFNVKEVEQKLKGGEMAPSDFIYVETKSDWIAVVDFEPLTEIAKKSSPKIEKPTKKEVVSANDGAADGEWYTLKGENRYGPFSFTDVIRMLQEKSLFEYEYVWRTGMATWQRVAEVEEFKAEKIRDFKNSGEKGVSELFFRRRHKRAKFDGSIIIHDNKQVWKGNSIEISAGGAGLVIENSMIVPGQTLFLHFKPGEGVPPFNAVCEVVSKRFLKGIKHKEQSIHYGVKFTNIGDKAKGVVSDFAEHGKKAA